MDAVNPEGPNNADPKVPLLLSAYHVANLLDAIVEHAGDGDWWFDLQFALGAVAERLGRTELEANSGRKFSWNGHGWQQRHSRSTPCACGEVH